MIFNNVLVPSWFMACTAVDAPTDFDALNSFLHQHFTSSDRYLEEGMENLIEWMPIHETAKFKINCH